MAQVPAKSSRQISCTSQGNSTDSSEDIPLRLVRRRLHTGMARDPRFVDTSSEGNPSHAEATRSPPRYVYETRHRKRKIYGSPQETRSAKHVLSTPVLLTDEFAEVQDYNEITYPVQIAVPHEPHTYRLISSPTDLAYHANIARNIRNSRLRRMKASPSPSPSPCHLHRSSQGKRSGSSATCLSGRRRISPTSTMLAQIQQDFLNNILFLTGAAKNSRVRPLTAAEALRVETLSDTFVKRFRDARREFEDGCRQIGILPAEDGGDETKDCDKTASTVQKERSRVSNLGGTFAMSSPTIIDLQDYQLDSDA